MIGTTPKDGQAGAPAARRSGHVCPWWLGSLLASPLRRWLMRPERWLGPHVRPGMVVLEPGCGMGCFSLPLARMVGPAGRVVCVDLQERMLEGLRRRARAAGLAERIELERCTLERLGLERWRGRIDLVAAIYMVHEVVEPGAFLAELRELLRPGGRLLVREPAGHVSRAAFAATAERVRRTGLVELDVPAGGRGWTGLWEKPLGGG
jgi:ubiquinone/menaquinone biosynthesis C-methylase UbiE